MRRCLHPVWPMRFFSGLLLALAMVVAFAGRPAEAQDGSVGVVVKLSGTAAVVREGATVALGLGDPIFVGDRLETEAASALGVTLKDNTLLSLGPSSVFELTDFVLDPVAESFALRGRIINGSMVVTTGEIGDIAPENVTFDTPYGVIGIRGTRFAVTVI
jgi:hypothetical protein